MPSKLSLLEASRLAEAVFIRDMQTAIDHVREAAGMPPRRKWDALREELSPERRGRAELAASAVIRDLCR